MYQLIVAIGFLILIGSCAHGPKIQTQIDNYRAIAVSTGPEDFVLDTLSGNAPRLLVSCGIKRKCDASKGEFVFIDLASKKVKKSITNLPVNFPLFPHGIDLLKKNDSLFLYAVNHQPKAKGINKDTLNSVLKFLVKGDSILFIQKFKSSNLKSPNAVCALADGSFLVTNMNSGSYFSKGNVCFCDEHGCGVVSPKIFYANGITRDENFVYVASTLWNKVYRFSFDGKKLEQKAVAQKVYGGDNLRIIHDTLFVAAHFNISKFLKHVKKESNHSPSAVYEIPLSTMQPKLVFYHDSTLIDASSTAIRFAGKYYITGVFDPEIVEIKVKN